MIQAKHIYYLLLLLYTASSSCGALRAQEESGSGTLVISETFALFTKGSDETPDTKDLTSSSTGMIADALTQQPGWSGAGIYSAGGSCLIAPYYDEVDGSLDGYLNTPRTNLYGEITITLRAKVHTASQGKLHINVARLTQNLGGYTASLSDQWQTITTTLRIMRPEAEYNSYIQFSTEELASILIDDIKIYRKALLAPPEKVFYRDFTATSFTAEWSPTTDATGYLVDVYTKESSQQDTVIAHPASDPLTWTKTGDSWLTPEGERIIKDLALYGLPAASSDSKGAIAISALAQGEWRDLGRVTLDKLTGGKYLSLKSYLPYLTTRVKLTFVKGGGDLRLQEITTIYEGQKVYHLQGHHTTETHLAVTGIDPNKDYYYTVSSQQGQISSTPSQEVWVSDLLTPQLTHPSSEDLHKESYTARWQVVPKADGYLLYNYTVTTVAQTGLATLLHDTFSRYETPATPDAPEEVPDDALILDNYTDLPGWLGKRVRLADGMLGCWGWGSSLQTPTLSLSHNEGNFRLTLSAWAKKNTDLIIKYGEEKDQRIILSFTDTGLQEHTFDLSGGSDSTAIRFYTSAGEIFFLDEISVEQELKAGAEYRTLLNNMLPIKSGQTNYYTLKDLPQDKVYEYEVIAYRLVDDMLLLSPRSSAMRVQLDTSITPTIGKSDTCTLQYSYGAQGLTLSTHQGETLSIYTTQGILLHQTTIRPQEEVTYPLAAGIYLVVHSGCNKPHKLLIP
ncbi:hypothetical protein [uncultured Porphyromonas sp.]|uniref:hypothetical protein n=1 Tax=uncultured Porphyromonas sp. TaxID=159274 RepID=UPI0025EB9207|nr:hypothetical protein [uncultured Porphyromonas sp.]